MPNPKTKGWLVPDQVGLASPDGTRAGAGQASRAPGEGTELLTDLEGALWVTLASGVVVPVDIEDLQRIAGVVPLMSAPGRLAVNIAANDVSVLLDGAGRVAGDVQRIAGVAPLVSGPGRLGVNIASGDVAVALDGAGRVRTVPENGNAVPVGAVTNAPSGGVVQGWGVGGARRLLRAYGYSAAGGGFVQVHNLAAGPPAALAVPLFTLGTPGGVAQNWEIDFTKIGGLDFTLGIQVYASTVAAAYTAPGTPSLLGFLSYQ